MPRSGFFSRDTAATIAFQTEPVGPTLGSLITAPGMYSFPIAPFAGPTPADKDELVLSLSFLLSPGDTARVASQFIIDEGTGIPFAEIPDFPDPADGPYFNVIDVDSPETSLPEDFTIGLQTQVNVSATGEIGPGLEAGSPQGDEASFDYDIQVNVSGGAIRRQAGFNRGFRSYAGSEVNLSGGVIEYLVAEHDSVVNVTGGRLGVDNEGDPFEALYVTDQSVANVSAGTVDYIDASLDSTVNISGGAVGSDAERGVVLRDNSVLNLSGGTVGLITLNSSAGRRTAHVSGGQVERVIALGQQSDVHISGGTQFSYTLHSVNMAPASLDLVHPDAMLTVTLSMPGDYNNDGVVDAADYVVWRDHLGSQTVLPHDVSPGSVTLADQRVWRTNFGRVFGENSSAAVPEPTCGVLFVLGSTLLLTLRGRMCSPLRRSQ